MTSRSSHRARATSNSLKIVNRSFNIIISKRDKNKWSLDRWVHHQVQNYPSVDVLDPHVEASAQFSAAEPSDEDTAEYLHASIPTGSQLSVKDFRDALEHVRRRTLRLDLRVNRHLGLRPAFGGRIAEKETEFEKMI
ncbi:hypothetical protein A0H81_11118 [Grifola frondosa]|uniref:Uncharacterized protein n=1 Tax=Grifola frondosa TaxID=5627 RepID=A0A1C7LVR7_GRIFR|nr:hypothetical protein A0H81_11118 [Grifola frondosa]